MPDYTFKLIVIGPEAVEKDRNRAMYSQYGFTEADDLFKDCEGIDALTFSRAAKSLRQAVFDAVADLLHTAPELPVVRVLAAPAAYSDADRLTALRFVNGHTPATLTGYGRQSGDGDPQPLTDGMVKHWITSWFHRTKSWPTSASGEIPGSDGETWADVDRALAVGERGLPAARSLAKFIAHHWKEDYGASSPAPSDYVRCGGTVFRLGCVQAMNCEEVQYRQVGDGSPGMRLRTKILISGEWLYLYGEQAHRVRDYLAQYWSSQRSFVDLDAGTEPTPPAGAGTQTPPASEPEPEPEKRRHFL